MRGPRALEMLKASREGSCPQGVPRQPLTHKRAPEVGTSGLLPASAPSGLWHPSRAILPRRTMETERRHAAGAACAPLGRGRVPCSRSSAGPVHLCKTQSCRAWPCSVRLPASLGAVCGCVDARSSRVGARGRREAPQGAPRTRNERLHPQNVRPPQRSSARPHHICPRPPNPLYQVPHQHHAHTAGAAHAIHGTRAAWPAVRAKPSQGSSRAAGACIEQSNAAQCCPRRASVANAVQCLLLGSQ